MKVWQRIAVLLAVSAAVFGAVWWGIARIAPVLAQEQAEKGTSMVVLMYHAVNSNAKKVGDYVITPQAFERDLSYLQNEGYQTVVMSDIIAYVRDGKSLPAKPIMITFDDGYYNNYLNVFPLLQKYQMKAVLSIIVGETDRYSELNENRENYSHVTWEMVNEMIDSGYVEIQNHSYNLHKINGARRGISKKKGETTEQYLESVGEDLKKAQNRIEEMTGWRPNTFTYPFGSYSCDSQTLLEELGFAASLGVEGKVYHITRDPACLIRIPRYNRTCRVSAQSILEKALGKTAEGGG